MFQPQTNEAIFEVDLEPTVPDRSQYKFLSFYYSVNTESCPEDATTYITDYVDVELTIGGTFPAVIDLANVAPGSCITFKAVLELKDNTEIIELASKTRELDISPQITKWEITHVANTTQYIMSAEFANLPDNAICHLRRMDGGTQCISPQILPASDGSTFQNIANEILLNGSFQTNFGSVANATIMLILADTEQNILDHAEICMDFNI